MIKVSVIIPVYNVEQYLPACLDSVLGQSLQELECICIDDASPDRCGEILDEYASRDARIKVIHLTENLMQGYGRNRGIENATGKYIYLLDSDDMITPTTLEELYELAERDSLDGIFFDSQTVFESDDLRKHASSYICLRQGEYPDAVLRGQDLLELFLSNKEWMVYIQRQFWRRDFLIENNIFFPEQRTEHEDELFSFEAILLAEKTRYIRKDFFIHRYRENSVMTRKPHPKDFHGYFTIYYKMAEFVETHRISSAGADECMLHMYDCIMNFLPDFQAEARPEDWFTPEEQERYRFFLAMLRSQKLAEKKKRDIWKPLGQFREYKIFGAGRVARSAYTQISGSYYVTGFLVTEHQGNPTELAGLPVQTVDEVRELPDSFAVVVAMAKELHPGPAALLAERGIPYFLYAKGELSGPFNTGAMQQ